MSQSIVIIGGGIAGLTNAYYLKKSGHDVKLISKDDITDNTSFGNAGLLSAFEKAPLASPGIISKTIKLMLQGKSPVIINPALDPKIYKWLFRFTASTTKARLKKSLIFFERYGERTLREYERIISEDGLDFDYARDGVYVVFTEKNSYEEKLLHVNDDSKYDVLSYEEAKANLGFVKDNVEGIINFKRNAKINPGKLMLGLKQKVQEMGVEFILNEEIVDWVIENKKIKKAIGRKNTYKADTFILATGADINLAKKLGNDLMLTPAKGYSLTFKMNEGIMPKQSIMFNDLFIIATPRSKDMRLTSKLEIASNNPNIVKSRIDSILTNLRHHTVDFEMRDVKTWTGFRPLTPNDMPLIGRDEKYRNLVHAMGYGWLGMTFGPALAQILENIITNDLENSQSDDILLFSGFYQGCL